MSAVITSERPDSKAASELIADYRTKYYGSTATAYRRLKRANEELERGQ